MKPIVPVRYFVIVLCFCGIVFDVLSAQVPSARLRNAVSEPENWLTYSGGYFSNRYTRLDQVTPVNVDELSLQWVYQTPVAGPWQSTPLGAGVLGLSLPDVTWTARMLWFE